MIKKLLLLIAMAIFGIGTINCAIVRIENNADYPIWARINDAKIYRFYEHLNVESHVHQQLLGPLANKYFPEWLHRRVGSTERALFLRIDSKKMVFFDNGHDGISKITFIKQNGNKKITGLVKEVLDYIQKLRGAYCNVKLSEYSMNNGTMFVTSEYFMEDSHIPFTYFGKTVRINLPKHLSPKDLEHLKETVTAYVPDLAIFSVNPEIGQAAQVRIIFNSSADIERYEKQSSKKLTVTDIPMLKFSSTK